MPETRRRAAKEEDKTLLDRVTEALTSNRLTFRQEDELQDAIASLLTAASIPFRKEVSLGDAGRIDFLLEGGIGIEVKVAGSPSSIAEQLVRYCSHRAISEIILVTSKARLGRIPDRIMGKRTRVISLWRTLL